VSTALENKAKLDIGYVKIATALGSIYQVFPFLLNSPLEGSSTEVQLSVSADPMFAAPLKYNKAVWIGYADSTLLNVRDFLVGEYGTFYVGDKQPFQPFQLVRTNRLASIGRGEYSVSGAITETVVMFAEKIPVFMQFTREDIQKSAATYSGSQIGRAVTHWTAFIPMPPDSLKQDDVLVDLQDGVTYIIDAPDFTNMGYVCHLRLSTI